MLKKMSHSAKKKFDKYSIGRNEMTGTSDYFCPKYLTKQLHLHQ